MSHDSSRRRFLAVAGSTTIAALAGCSGGDGGASTETDPISDGMTETDSMDGDGTDGEGMNDGGMTDPVTVRVENVAPTDAYGAETPTGGAVWSGSRRARSRSTPATTRCSPRARRRRSDWRHCRRPARRPGSRVSLDSRANFGSERGAWASSPRGRTRPTTPSRTPTTPPGRGPDQAPAQGVEEGGVVRRLADVDDGHEYPAASDIVRVTLTPHGDDDGM